MQRILRISFFSVMVLLQASAFAAQDKNAILYLHFQSDKELRFTLKADAGALLGIKTFPQQPEAEKMADKKTIEFKNKLNKILIMSGNLNCTFKTGDVALEHFGSRSRHQKPTLNVVVHGKFVCPQSLENTQLSVDLSKSDSEAENVLVQLFSAGKLETKVQLSKGAKVILHPPNQISLAPPEHSTHQSN